MRNLIPLGMFATILCAPATWAQSSLDGTWKIDLKSAKLPTKPDVYLLQNGTYECKTCVPPMTVKADGQDHQVTGNPYIDMASIKVIDNNSIEETDKKNGKTVTVGKTTVSADGKSLHFEFTDSSDTNAAPVTGKGTAERVAAGPAGSHVISGSWRTTKLENFSDNALMTTLKVAGDSLTMTTPTGQSYTAKLDGTEAPYKGDPGVTTVSVKSIDKNTIEETDKREGKVINVLRIALNADGKTMTLTAHNLLQDTTTSASATKQ
jgi:hypothetical protein